MSGSGSEVVSSQRTNERVLVVANDAIAGRPTLSG